MVPLSLNLSLFVGIDCSFHLLKRNPAIENEGIDRLIQLSLINVNDEEIQRCGKETARALIAQIAGKIPNHALKHIENMYGLPWTPMLDLTLRHLRCSHVDFMLAIPPNTYITMGILLYKHYDCEELALDELKDAEIWTDAFLDEVKKILKDDDGVFVYKKDHEQQVQHKKLLFKFKNVLHRSI